MTISENISIGVEELLSQAERLGLKPVYRQGTVLGTPIASLVMITLDNDTKPSRCFNYAGYLAPGDRVLTVTIRPQGIYVLGTSNPAPNPAPAGINVTSPTETTVSATFVSLGAVSSFSFTKFRADTRIEIDMRVGFFVTGVANTEGEFGVLVNGTDYVICTFFINPLSTHMLGTGKDWIPGIPAGTYTIQGRWRRSTGTGTLNRAVGDDWLHISARETF